MRIIDMIKMIVVRTAVLPLLMLVSNAALCQHIHLTPPSGTGKGIDLMVGKRVSTIISKDKRKAYPEAAVVGELSRITKDSIVVDNTAIALSDLSHIGRRKGGSGAVSYILSFAGAGSFMSGISTGNASYLAFGAAFLIIGINTGVRNSAKDLSTWKWEVVD